MTVKGPSLCHCVQSLLVPPQDTGSAALHGRLSLLHTPIPAAQLLAGRVVFQAVSAAVPGFFLHGSMHRAPPPPFSMPAASHRRPVNFACFAVLADGTNDWERGWDYEYVHAKVPPMPAPVTLPSFFYLSLQLGESAETGLRRMPPLAGEADLNI